MRPVVAEWWGRVWPSLLAAVTVTAVGAPAAVASYIHARTVVERSGDPVMAPWLPLSVDGMLLAALVVIWVRRHRGRSAGVFPWFSFGLGMVATIAANLAAADPTSEGYVVALWPPVALALTLELVALVANRSAVRTNEPPVRNVVAEVVRTTGQHPAVGELEQPPDRAVEPRTTEADHRPDAASDRAQTVAEYVNGSRLSAVPDLRHGQPDHPDHLAEEHPVASGAEAGSDHANQEADQLLDEVVRWAADRDEPPTARAIRSTFRVGHDRSVRLLEQWEAARSAVSGASRGGSCPSHSLTHEVFMQLRQSARAEWAREWKPTRSLPTHSRFKIANRRRRGPVEAW